VLPGGDIAAREIWRLAAALRLEKGETEAAIAERLPGVPADALRAVLAMVRRGLRCLPTSSLGRMFDAAAALLGVALENTFEGEAPMKLEALARQSLSVPAWPKTQRKNAKNAKNAKRLRPPPSSPGSAAILDLRALLFALADEADPALGAARFHRELARLLADWAADNVPVGASTILLSGGCLQNALLADGLSEALTRRGLRPVLPKRVPPGDGGIAYGQAVLAARRTVSCAAAISLPESSRHKPSR
ncbi:MAG: carbamoyltransferase HypF, partial [Zoogloeaceae bacterium]|nr:carbamoyltransferase HypF [Zoogloeaceae bacterium]